MGYNKADYIRIKAEYTTKYIKAQERADARREELYEAIPEVRELDRILSRTGLEIMAAIAKQSREVAEQRVAAIKERNGELLKKRAQLLAENGYAPDYSDVKYECEACGDTGFVNTKMCTCMRRALVLAGYESSGLGGLIRTQSFDNFSLDFYRDGGDYERMARSVAALRHFGESFSEDTARSYLLVGGTGLGKTHLSTALAKTVIDRGFDVLYVTSVGMIGDFETRRFGNGEGARDTSRYYDAQLLIIDDFGTEVVNQFTVSCMYDVINSRINNRKSTIINTNLSHKEMEQKYGERIASRLFGEYNPIRFTGTDIRRQKLTKK